MHWMYIACAALECVTCVCKLSAAQEKLVAISISGCIPCRWDVGLFKEGVACVMGWPPVFS